MSGTLKSDKDSSPVSGADGRWWRADSGDVQNVPPPVRVPATLPMPPKRFVSELLAG